MDGSTSGVLWNWPTDAAGRPTRPGNDPFISVIVVFVVAVVVGVMFAVVVVILLGVVVAGAVAATVVRNEVVLS